ncbi:MAG: carotenoid oxygenase family protein [Hyphomicrobium sp.]|jgi:carotenoid cleavage dioxygenase-like enzyme
MAGSDRASYASGFADLDSEVGPVPLSVAGDFPMWLSGSLLRTGPAKFDIGRTTVNHWFDGLAMLHRFGFSDGEVTYTNRFLRSEAYCESADEGGLALGGFATDPCRTLFQRVAAVFSPHYTDNGNVNIDVFAGETVALTETTLPVRFDAETLETLGQAPISANIGGQLSIAHPHHDMQRRCRFSYVVEFGARSHYRLFAIPDDGSSERVVAEMPIDKPAYMHSFAMTERYLVLTEFPIVVDPLRLLLGVAPFIRNYRWMPERGLKFHIFDKDSGALVGSRSADAAFAFHHVNAFEDGGNLLIDAVVYDNPDIIDQLYLAPLRAGEPVNATGRPTRFTVPLDGEGRVRASIIADEMLELPRIDYERCAGRPYRYMWGNGRTPDGDFLDSIVRVDVGKGETDSWHAEGCFPGEPVFVAKPDAQGEGEGVLLSVVLDARRGSSFLMVLDAQNLAEIARAVCPHQIPFGLHGGYFPGR